MWQTTEPSPKEGRCDLEVGGECQPSLYALYSQVTLKITARDGFGAMWLDVNGSFTSGSRL